MHIRAVAITGILVLLVACQELPQAPPTPVQRDEIAELARAGDPEDRVRVMVELRARGDQDGVVRRAEGIEGRVVRQYRHLPVLALEVPRHALLPLRNTPGVVHVAEDQARDPLLNQSLPVINADQVHALGWDGSGMTVAILDTGVDPDHPFYAGRVVEEFCFSSPDQDAGRRSLCPNGETSQSGPGAADIKIDNCRTGFDSTNICDHGSHVAGIAAGDGTDLTGVPDAGVAPGADIIGLQVFTRFNLSADCSPRPVPCVKTFDSDWTAGVDQILTLAAAGQYNIAAANMSFGGGEFFEPCDGESLAASAAILGLILRNIAPVISAGNDRLNAGVAFPACIGAAITVGATNNDDEVAGFSNRGTLLDLFAPGSVIRSSLVSDQVLRFGNMSGTSMAAPHVTGAWAVLRQVEPGLSVQQARERFRATGLPITYSSNGGSVTTPRIDLLAAIAAGSSPPVLAAAAATVTVDEGQTAMNTGSVSDPDGDPITGISASVGTVSLSGDTWNWNFATEDGPAESQVVTITASDNRGAQGTVTFALTVNNVAPIVDAGPDPEIESGETFHFLGTFNDPGVVDFLWGWEIDWGDGSPTVTGSTNTQSAPIQASRQFCAAGPYTVRLTVTDKDGDAGFDEATVTVAYRTVTIRIQPGNESSPLNLRSGGRLPVSVLSSADFDATRLDLATVVLGNETDPDTPVARRPNGTYFATVADVNGDGLPDLLLHFEIPALVANGDLTGASTHLVLRGILDDGCTNVRSEGAVRVVP